MAVDGPVLDVPDSRANARVFGFPTSPHGTTAAFPKMRLVLLIEAGTHLIADTLLLCCAIFEEVILGCSKNPARSFRPKNRIYREIGYQRQLLAFSITSST